MIDRHLLPLLRRAADQFPVITLTGPRQSGKTTLARHAFPRHEYISLENPDQRAAALDDPRGFLDSLRSRAILDEAQRAPHLFSYLQQVVDDDPAPGRFVLTGSQNFLLLRSVSQSLAGRAAILHLLPLSLTELTGVAPLRLDRLGRWLPNPGGAPAGNLMETLFRGFYPRVHDRQLDPRLWFPSYRQTWLERDVRDIVNVGDLEAFGRFLRLSAGWNGQLLNLNALAADTGVSRTTARRWLSVLEAGFVVVRLRPHFRNFRKRLVKSPRLYFLDTGLLCSLLGIRSADELRFHSGRGAVFESFVAGELLKARFHAGQEPDIFFWRDSAGREVDFVIGAGSDLVAVEARSGQTVVSDFFKGLRYWRELTGDPGAKAALVYGGDRSYRQSGVVIHRWADI